MSKNVSFKYFLRKIKNSKVNIKIRYLNFTQKILKFHASLLFGKNNMQISN